MITVVATAVAWRAWQAKRAAASVGLAATNEIRRLRTQFKSLQEARIHEENSKAEIAASKAPVKRKTWAEVEAESSAEARAKYDAYRAKLLDAPQLQRLYGENKRAYYGQMFGAFFRQWQFTPEQRQSFLAVFVKDALARQDIEAIAKARGLSRNDPAVKAQLAALDAEFEGEMQARLGPDALKILRVYTSTESARSYLSSYAGLFARLGEPLTIEQLETLTTIFAKAAPNGLTVSSRVSSAQWNGMWAEAERVLTPAQWREFQIAAPPGQAAGPWESALNDALAKATGGVP